MGELQKNRVNFEREGRYEEAAAIAVELEQSRSSEQTRRRHEMRSNMQSERMEANEKHLKTLDEFNLMWDRKQAEYDAHAADLQAQLTEKHKKSHQAYLEKLQRETEPRTVRWSAELLNQRKIEEALAKQKKYNEAQEIRAALSQMEAKEQALWKAKRDVKISGMEQLFLQKQQMEMNGLVKRIMSGQEEQKVTRQAEKTRLLQRYQNTKTQLDSQHRIAQQRSTKQFAVSQLANST